MFEIADRLVAALDGGRTLAIATAVSIEGSAPRTVGTSMAFDGRSVIGSIAGGCVEGAVVDVCELVLADGVARTVDYGVSDETAFAVGLTCGGQLRIRVTPVTPQIEAALRAAAASSPAGVAIALGDVPARFDGRIAAELDARVAMGETALAAIDCDGELVDVFFEVATPPARLIVFGAMEFSVALAAAGSALGYRVTVCDPRSLFATAARFPTAEVVVEWPTTWLARTPVDERTVVCVLAHDDRFDAEIIAQSLALPVAFVGAMGSRRTHERRVASLRDRGVSEAQIERLHSPIGLDLGASTPEETAVSILAEIISARTRASAEPLRATSGSIHRPHGSDALVDLPHD
ncbi:XdhC family protein [Conyzicola sp.]|uniref:XdhC family protein n=1 Tax=Conyzicola sp. TaxID=1969404 RepID=UPI003989ECA6